MIDLDIVDRISKGDQDAFREMYDLYKYRVYKTACLMLNGDVNAEDVLQEVFITVYSKIYRLKSSKAFESWLYRITVNCCIDFLRKHKPNLLPDEEFSEIVSEDTSKSPENSAVRNELSRELKKHIYELPAKQKSCLILFYYNHFTIKQIAEIMECTEGTVKSNLFKSKKALEKEILKSSDGGEIAWI